MSRAKLSIIAVAAAISLGSSALAHGPGTQSNYPPCGTYYGGHMGPMMGPDMMGPGMMGPGQMTPDRMGPGAMGHGMMGRGMGHDMMQPLRQDLSIDDVKHMIGHRLSWTGNPNLKLGSVEEKDADTIIAEIVTQDGSLVQRFKVDRHTGWMQPDQ